MNPAPPQRTPSSGFTLVEMLVSVAVLVLIMTFIAQMMNSATISTTLSGRHVDTDSEARLVFDRMQSDFSRMSHRTDVDFVFAKQPDYLNLNTSGNTGSASGTDAEMFFYSEAPAYPASTSGTDPSSVALIGYTINTTGSSYIPAYSLQRLSKGLTLNSQISQTSGTPDTETASMLFLTSTGLGGLPLAATGLLNSEPGVIGVYPDTPADNTDYDLLSPEVLRMDFTFQVKDLTNPSAPSAAYSNFPCAFYKKGATNTRTINSGPPSQSPTNGSSHPVVGDRWYDTSTNRCYICTTLLSNGPNQFLPVWEPNGMADVNAIVVTIAILDQRSRRVLPDDTVLSALAGSFLAPTEGALNPIYSGGSASGPPQLTADLWQTELSDMLLAAQDNSSSKVPVSVLGQVRIYQRFFYLNN